MLTRKAIKQLSHLLEDAAFASSIRHPKNFCYASSEAHERLRERINLGRRHQSNNTWRKATRKQFQAPKESVRDTVHPSSATAALVADSSQRHKTATAEQASTNSALKKLSRILLDAETPLRKDRPALEQEVINSLKLCKDLAKTFKESATAGPDHTISPVVKQLFSKEFGEDNSVENTQDFLQEVSAVKDVALDQIAHSANAFFRDPKVFITPDILKAYVLFAIYVSRLEALPQAFELYANKPVPSPNSSPVTYKDPSPDKASSAVPADLASLALEAAMEARELSVSLDIIDSTVSKKAFRRYKLIQQALLPGLGVALAPAAAYAMARQFAIFQDQLDSATTTWVGFAGITSYIAFTGTIGIVAIATSNDQMERVTWASGMPLRHRWLREAERAMLDRVVCSWGFKDRHRRGEEEGPEWEALKELISVRGMVLDKVELMDGMS